MTPPLPGTDDRRGLILLADDSGLAALIARTALEAEGHTVLEVADGVEALAVLRARRVDLVVTDWLMPNLDGLGLMRAIRSSPELEQPYVIFLTSMDRRAQIVEGLEAGADDYLPKPFDPEELLARVRAGLRVVRLQRGLEAHAAELERSNAAFAQFASVASHDLNEPLRTITSYLALLRERVGGRLGPDADEFLGFAVDGATRMRRLIDDLLVWSRVDGESHSATPVDLSAEVATVLDDLSCRIAAEHAVVEVGSLPVVPGDASQLRRVLANVIGNALKFRGAADPHVRVAATATPDTVRLTVTDNGVGVDPDDAARIFDMFTRVGHRDAYEGTGLGLAICRRIVERHGGGITVTANPGGGAAFVITLPAVAASPLAA